MELTHHGLALGLRSAKSKIPGTSSALFQSFFLIADVSRDQATARVHIGDLLYAVVQRAEAVGSRFKGVPPHNRQPSNLIQSEIFLQAAIL